MYTAYVMAEKIYVINEVLLTYRKNNKNSTTIMYKNEAKEYIEENLMELRLFLLKKNLYDIYKNSFERISILF